VIFSKVHKHVCLCRRRLHKTSSPFLVSCPDKDIIYNLLNPYRLQRNIRPLHRAFTSTTSKSSPSSRETVLYAALPHVHEHGWTDQALAQGVLSSKLPPSYIGMVEDKKSDLINFFMNDCNVRLENEFKALRTKDDFEKMTHSQVIEWGIRKRLEMNVTYVRSKRWHEGMALGAMPTNAYKTATHLETMVKVIENNMGQSLGRLERGAIGAVYIATELHLLSDDSVGYQDTWRFLVQRVRELELAAQSNFSAMPSSDMMVAGAAVASSLAGGLVSLFVPAAMSGIQAVAGNVIPQIMNYMQPPTIDSTVGTKAQDYDLSDLPPFETDKSSHTAGSNETKK
jgi:rpsU-divergently transcribed protein